MADLVLVDGDLATFDPSFGPATVVVRPGTLRGSGPATFGGALLCVDGDEASVEVAGCLYTTPLHSIPGTGTLKIAALAPDQRATKIRVGGVPALLKGSTFTATFEVRAPAMQPPPGPGGPIPDPTPSYPGTGRFTTTHSKLRGT